MKVDFWGDGVGVEVRGRLQPQAALDPGKSLPVLMY